MNFGNPYFEAAYGTAGQLPPSDIPEIAFSGRSNVGKSSLLNAIMSRKALARTSSTPGKTTTINFFRLGDKDGQNAEAVRFCDLPGYGYAKVSGSERIRWGKMMESYFSGGRDIRLTVQLIDMRHPPSKDDIQMLEFLESKSVPFIIVLTKSDKLNKSERAKRLELLKTELSFLGEYSPPIPFSALNKEGTEEIKKFIENLF